MNTIHRNHSLDWEGYFVCQKCGGDGCDECNLEGIIKRKCELRFDIDAGEPATGTSGPPENYDPGYGPEIHKIGAYIDGVDITAQLNDIDQAEEFIYENFSAPEPDYDDCPDYDEEDL